MDKPWSVVDDEELARMKLHGELLREALITGAVWVGCSSGEWTRMLQIAKESGIPGLVDELNGIKEAQAERRRIYGY